MAGNIACHNLSGRLSVAMAGTLFHKGVVQVVIGAEDHPPPHVHAYHPGEGWLARFRFSFLSDVTGLYRFKRAGRRPTNAALDAIAAAIEANIRLCRADWWRTHGGRLEIGLVNRQAETRPARSGDGVLVRVALKLERPSYGILSATYNVTMERSF